MIRDKGLIEMKHITAAVHVVLALLGLTGVLTLSCLLGGSIDSAYAVVPLITPTPPFGDTRYVSPDGADTGNNCANSNTPCATIQHAVDQASNRDIIEVAAGTYTDLSVRPRADVTTTGVVTQVVYISKTVTIRGGYTTSNWVTPNPEANPTILDAQGRGRVLYITGNPSLRLALRQGSGQGSVQAAGSGQAIRTGNVQLTLEGLRIAGGDATGLGGSIVEEPPPPQSRLDGYVWDFDCGGGIYVITATVTIRDSQVASNTAAYEGGGMYATNATVDIAGSRVSSNVATSLGVGSSDGGGLYLGNSDVTLSGNTFTSNTAYAGGGGGLYLYGGEATLDGNAFISNDAYGGGGLCLVSHAATLVGNSFISNSALRGGGLAVYGDDVVLDSNTIIANDASTSGGGIYLSGADDVSLDGNIVVSNTASHDGGGVYVWLSDVALTNDVVADNQVILGNGSGLYVEASHLRSLHTTVARNGAGDDDGIYVSDYSGHYSTVALTNTIVAAHMVGIVVTAGNTVTLNATLWYGNVGGNTGGAGSVSTLDDYSGDPAFAPDGYHLTLGSAAIDQGADAGVTSDVDGEPRPYQIPDLGADEYWPPGALACVYLPLVMQNYLYSPPPPPWRPTPTPET